MSEDITDDVSSGTEEEVKIPERFQGKSMEDIVKSYQEIEKAYSKQGNDLGMYRKLADKLLQADLEKSTPKKEPEPEPDWEYEPEKAASTLVKKEVGQLKSELDKTKTELALKDFKAKYPNYEQDTGTPEFMDWVQKSKYRVKLYNKNYTGIDLDAADELLGIWEDYKSLKSQSSETAKEKQKEDLKAASLEKSASSGGLRKKMWSREEIIDMKLHRKSEYEAHRNDIRAAYREGRVK